MIARPARRPATPSAGTANDRFKASFDRVLWGSLIGATVLHFAAFALWPEMVAPDVSAVVTTEPEIIELPEEIDLPEAPERLDKPAAPVPVAEADPEATMDPSTFEANPPSTLPPLPPPSRARGAEREAFVVYDVKPLLQNRAEVARAMTRAYPDILRNAGIGGTVRVELYIDEAGVVRDTRVVESSGHARLDAAALEVADLYRFSPAMNRDQAVPVWISLPITFEVR